MSGLDDLILSHAAHDGDIGAHAYDDAAWAFTSAGGILTLSDYRGLSAASRAALRRAHERLWAERAQAIAATLVGDLGGEAAQAMADRLADAAMGGM